MSKIFNMQEAKPIYPKIKLKEMPINRGFSKFLTQRARILSPTQPLSLQHYNALNSTKPGKENLHRNPSFNNKLGI